MKNVKLYIIFLFFCASFSEADMLEDYYQNPYYSVKDFTLGIAEIDSVLESLKESKSMSSRDYFFVANLFRDRIYLEGQIKIKIEKSVARDQWFSSEYFSESYKRVDTNFTDAIQADKKELLLTTKELSSIYASPFASAEVKEKAYKHSLLILKEEDIGTGEHPLTKDQYVGRIYERIMQDYCSQGKCSEVNRLAEELGGYSEENKLLAEKLLIEYSVSNESKKNHTENIRETG